MCSWQNFYYVPTTTTKVPALTLGSYEYNELWLWRLYVTSETVQGAWEPLKTGRFLKLTAEEVREAGHRRIQGTAAGSEDGEGHMQGIEKEL